MAGAVPVISLRDGNSMPQLGFGTWQIPNAECPRLVGKALELGYRAIDTAQGYGNEGGIGRAIIESGVPRKELFVTTKLRNGAHRRDLAFKSVEESLDRLGLDYLDLLLIHWPVPEQDLYVEAWRALNELQVEGLVRSIGVSNFDREHLERITTETGMAPVLNQIECHPRWQQRDFRGYHLRRGIRLASWSPLGPETGNSLWWNNFGRHTEGGLFEDRTILALAEKHRRSPAQIILRWHIQDGLIVFPKSSHKDHIAENFELFDFELDAEDMYRIEALDSPTGRIGAAPSEWNLVF